MKKIILLLAICLSSFAFAEKDIDASVLFNYQEHLIKNEEMGGYNCSKCNGAHIPDDKLEEHITFHREMERMGFQRGQGGDMRN